MRASARVWLPVGLCALCPAVVLAQSATGSLPPQPAAPPGTATASAPASSTPPVAPAPAPSAAPATPAPQTGQPPPGYPPPGYPPPGYPPPSGYEQYPPPSYGYGYPPPGYYYPPPGYGWGPAARPKPQYPDDAAGQTTPFIDLLVAGVAADKRYDHIFTVGVQGGAYLGSRFRLVVRALLFTSEPDDDMAYASSYDEDSSLPSGYVGVASDRPSVLVGAAAGVGAVVRRNFVFAPGLAFHTTNVGDYGSLLALSMPFEWVTDDGTRFGFEIDIGRGFGGKVTGRCELASCTEGTEDEFDRPAAPAFFAAFQLGWGFNHPPAKYPESRAVP
ncbi:MAG: hypothetical protein IT377_23960 [Polyangiaceae bacterium]|nr:hypothetical protein [Polyangiaceae bacterium]